MTVTTGTKAKNPNPQGKGLVPVLDDLQALTVLPGGPKTPAQFLRDYFVSSLILSARFRFRPVAGRSYFLYSGKPEWLLSLIAPTQWHGTPPGEFVGRCRLRADMTWELETRNLEHLEEVSQDVMAYIDAFVDRVTAEGSVASSLPFYLSTLPYHQRALATALAASLQHSITQAGEGDNIAGRVDLLLSDAAAMQRLLGPGQAAS